jgi:N-acetylglucosaminyldiphosphoundecaprenol N-acetyl-beta-D-mannosaminyltransferase
VDALKRVLILNGGFHPLTLDETADRMMDMVRSGERGYVCTVNVAILMMMRSDSRLQRFVDRASLVVADGQPLVWVSRALRTPLPERVAGIDLIDSVCERAEREDIGVYLMGARREIVEGVADRLRNRYPKLKLAGVADGYFPKDESDERASAVADSGAQILFTGMGVPLQEHFLEEQFDRLGVNVAIGVGGSFDVLAGLRSRAPLWIQRLGLEWLYRVAQEPGRLWKRYLTTNSQFLFLACRELLFGSRRRAGDDHQAEGPG